MSCVCVIPARGGSQRVPGKNKRLFHGKPIIAYSIEVAQKSKLFDQIIVSTDDDDISMIAKTCGAVVLRRSEELSKNDIGTQEVMKYVLTQIKEECFAEFDYACCLYATSPMLTPNLLAEADSILWSTGNDYVIPIAKWLEDPGMFYFGRSAAFIKEIPLISDSISLMSIPESIACDINTEEDWLRAEQMYTALHNIKEKS